MRSRPLVNYVLVALTAVGFLLLYYLHALSLRYFALSFMRWFWHPFYFELHHRLLGVTLLVPMVYAAMSLGWKRAWFIIVAIAVSALPYVLYFSYGLSTLMTSLVILLGLPTLVMTIDAYRMFADRERLAREEKERQRLEVARQVFSAQEEERKRISQDLHDGVLQTLLATGSLAHGIQQRAHYGGTDVVAALESIQFSIMNSVTEMRCICQDLRPSIIDSLGLVAALRWLVYEFQQGTAGHVHFALHGTEIELEPDERVAIFRTVQEALNNVQKHARATSVKVQVCFSEHDVVIEIRDDGQGFEWAGDESWFAVQGKLGILNMTERVQSIGGQLQVETASGSGTLVRLCTSRSSYGT